MSDALPCPKCGGDPLEQRVVHYTRPMAVLGGFQWYCFDPKNAIGECGFTGPERDTSEKALQAWNELERA